MILIWWDKNFIEKAHGFAVAIKNNHFLKQLSWLKIYKESVLYIVIDHHLVYLYIEHSNHIFHIGLKNGLMI